MSDTCVFCGATGNLTAEHVFGKWLSKIGLDPDPVAYGAGWLNRSPRDLGVAPPFSRRVRAVCGPCNHGWMSQLEATAQRALTPLILGTPGIVTVADQPGIAAWAHKTVLVAMLVSSKEDRVGGYGLPLQEYRDLFAIREQAIPLPDTRFWIGRHASYRRSGAVWATPLVVEIDGMREPVTPQAYVITIVLGELVVHGVRFTSPLLQLDVTAGHALSQIWPVQQDIDWPLGTTIDDQTYLRLGGGRDLEVSEAHVALRPWKPATELPASKNVGSMVQLPTPCGEHFVFYPVVLLDEARRGVYYAFGTACECGKAYLVHTEPDGSHYKAEGHPVDIEAMYEAVPGDEIFIEDENGVFPCKRISDVS